MRTPPDMHLWNHVARTVTPLGEPLTGSPRLYPTPFPTTLDLHGYTIEEAYQEARAYLSEAQCHHREVTVITGRSGQIRAEFPVWAAEHPCVRAAEERNGGGAYLVKLVRE
jgi:DNA-nicking Smr family endonuclease